MRLIKSLLVALLMGASTANADIIIEYSEVGSDLLLEFTGSFGQNLNVASQNTSTFGGIGNQAPNANSVFYSSATGFRSAGNFQGVTASAASFWDVSYDTTGHTATGDTLLFRYNSFNGGNSLDLWLNGGFYTAGDLIQGSLTAGGYSIASSGITDWNVDLGQGLGSIFIQAKDVPAPASLGLIGLGLIAMLAGNRRRYRTVR